MWAKIKKAASNIGQWFKASKAPANHVEPVSSIKTEHTNTNETADFNSKEQTKQKKSSFLRAVGAFFCSPLSMVGTALLVGTLSIPVIGWGLGLALVISSAVASTCFAIAGMREKNKAIKQAREAAKNSSYVLDMVDDATNVATSNASLLVSMLTVAAHVLLPMPVVAGITLLTLVTTASSATTVLEEGASYKKTLHQHKNADTKLADNRYLFSAQAKNNAFNTDKSLVLAMSSQQVAEVKPYQP